MRHVHVMLAMLFTGLLATACSDVPTASTGVEVGHAGPSSAIILEPVVVVGKCDPYLSLDWCGGSDPGGGDCMTSTEDSDLQYTSGCNTGGGGGGGPKSPSPTAPKPCPDYGCPTPTSPYEEGPLAWGACVLAVLGTAYTIDQVAGAFESWWQAQQDYESARRMLEAIQANPGSYTAEMMSLWEFRVEYAEDRRDAAIDSIREKTGGTYLALAGAGAACSIAAFLPTP